MKLLPVHAPKWNKRPIPSTKPPRIRASRTKEDPDIPHKSHPLEPPPGNWIRP